MDIYIYKLHWIGFMIILAELVLFLIMSLMF